ncbi:serine/threonine-protein kinase [Streptomyces sp. NPDC057757]|uniref:serine/threonine-protein kinase n=1 Tax=Streptomyces sp. NPDC057757 TaxID=3346241 RepID=UPI0036869D95
MGTEGDNARVIAGRYRLEARIGRGGMGVVWRANDQLLGRRVAVKEIALDTTLSADEARQQRDRTLHEARAVAQLRHPHIIVVHDVVEDDERPYIVMELIEGGSLAERISEQGVVDAREAARIGIGLLGALRRAHDAGVLHRDLKPANVLLAEDGRVVLTDFGIAQVAGATTLTETGAFVGSPEYTAPERMAGMSTGPESDLWSLGVLLCTVLSGESPFHRDSLGGILHAVVVGEIRPPAQARPLLPVVRGLLERDPEHRLDAAEAERMLSAFLDTGRTPRLPAGYTPTQRDVPVLKSGPAPSDSPSDAPWASPPGPPRSTRSILVAAALVAAMAGAGVSAAALLMNDGRGGGGGTPAPSSTASTSSTASSSNTASNADTGGPAGTGSAAGTGSSAGTSGNGTSGTGAPGASASASPSGSSVNPVVRKVPAGYRVAPDPNGFSLAVPDDFTREPQGERVFYMSPGQTFRLGIKVAETEPGGPLAVMSRADAKGPDTNPGYRDAVVAPATHGGRPAAFWEFTWNGFTGTEGTRHTYDLCWEEGGRMYDVWVSAPVGRATEAKEYLDVAVDTFVVS